GPEQGVEIDDVLADEMHEFGFRGVRGIGEAREVARAEARLAAAVAQLLEGRQITDWRIDPDVEILARFTGNLEAEIRRVARHVPAAQAVREPLLELVDDLVL